MNLELREIGDEKLKLELEKEEPPEVESDLPPEFCHYRDEGCEFADACLDCPFPQCLYDEPRGKQRWLKELRNKEIVRLFGSDGRGVKELASAPSGGDFEYCQPFLDKPDVYRGFFVEKFSGTESYHRPFWSHSVLDTCFLDNLWREPVPFNLSSEYGLAIAHYGDYSWLTSPYGVWRAGLTAQSLDLTADVVAVRQELGERTGKLAVELRNDDGQYASPGQGALAVLDIGCQLDFRPGYVTTAGNEVSSGQTFSLEAYEYTSSGGKAALIIQAQDGGGRWGTGVPGTSSAGIKPPMR